MTRRLLKVFLAFCGVATVVYVMLVMLTASYPSRIALINNSDDIHVYRLSVGDTVAKNRKSRQAKKPELKTPRRGKEKSVQRVAEFSRHSAAADNFVKDDGTELNTPKRGEKTSQPRGAAQTPNSSAADSTITNSVRYLVFVCDGRRSCGGWGDRQRGLVGVYLLAHVTGRRFAMVMTRPCDVINHYVPHLVAWNVPVKVLQAAGLTSNLSLDDVDSRQRLTARLRVMDFNAVYPQTVVYIRTNAEYWLGIRASKLYTPVLPDWARGSRARYFAAGWTRLTAPSPSLQARLDRFLDRIDFDRRTRPLVCAHVRVGHSANFKRETAVRCNITTLPVLWDFLQPWVTNGSDVFLATDSYEVRNLTRHRFGARMLDTGEEIVHVDGRSTAVQDVCHGFQSALLDQLILTRCDVLVTSHSIFSQRAAYLRGRSDNLYSFLKGKITRYFI
ncbi:uncharacterized protein [Littorina saxatilis]|uniref:Uncharacterized protein n=1 Tax=Littorina saxatilis TaxID=31220 RepID=A0AAN9G6J3_9CAEN